jgi:Phage head maturation protease
MVMEPIGWVEMEEDEKGAQGLPTGKLILDVQRAAEARALMKEDAINGLSIGFEYVKWENIDGGKGKIVTEIKLWEVSAVTFPAQPAAMIETVKSLDISKLETDDMAGEEKKT